jgi:hypothetical protein
MFKSFLNESRLEKWANEIETFAGLTENFTPKDLRHVAAKIQLKFNLGKGSSINDVASFGGEGVILLRKN